MSPHLNRRRALIVAGQGMAGLLLAACGRASGQSAAVQSPTGATSVTAGPALPPTPVAKVTVPVLRPTEVAAGRSTGISAGRDLLPSGPVVKSTSSAGPKMSPTTAVPPDQMATVAPTTRADPGPAGRSTPTTVPDTASAPGSTRTDTASSSTVASTHPASTAVGTSPPVASASRTSPATESTASVAPVTAGRLAGKVVALDPGHNGANAEHPEIINQLIDGGYGQRHACNTTGTQTDDGYPEHQFAWQVASLLQPMLMAQGITVVMTRSDDSGVGPCTNRRAAIENGAAADAVVSIHGDGAPAQVRGFYVLTATRPPAGPATAAKSLRLAACIARSAVAAGFPPSNTLGSGGLWKRDDLTGLNLSTRPKVLIECGNMRNAQEAATMSSNGGQRRYAQALADGIVSYLRS